MVKQLVSLPESVLKNRPEHLIGLLRTFLYQPLPLHIKARAERGKAKIYIIMRIRMKGNKERKSNLSRDLFFITSVCPSAPHNRNESLAASKVPAHAHRKCLNISLRGRDWTVDSPSAFVILSCALGTIAHLRGHGHTVL